MSNYECNNFGGAGCFGLSNAMSVIQHNNVVTYDIEKKKSHY